PFGPVREHDALDQFLVCLFLLRLHGYDGGLRELAHRAGLFAGVAIGCLCGRGPDGRPHLVFVALYLLEEEGLHLRIETLPGIEIDGQHIDAPAKRHWVNRFRHFGPAGGVPRERACDATIHHARTQCRHHFGKRHADRGCTDTGQKVAHGIVEDAYLLTFKAVEATHHLTTPEYLLGVATEGQEHGIPVLLHLPDANVAV